MVLYHHISVNSHTSQEKKFIASLILKYNINTKIIFILCKLLRIVVLYFTLLIYNVALDTEAAKTVQ